MSLREHCEHSGNWLFKKRSYLPLVLLPIIFFSMLASHDYPQAFAQTWLWKGFSFVVSFVGLLWRAYVIGQVPKGTSGRNTHGQVAETLNTKGLYSMVRHPLYLGNYLMILGIVLWTGLWWLVLLYSLLFWLYYERIMFAEEEFLRRKFGQTFEEWSSKTPAFVPVLSRYCPADLCFSMKNVLQREYSGLFAMVVSFVALEVFDAFVVSKSHRLGLPWVVLLSATVLFVVVLRFVRKKTRLLHVEGR